jgi:hypothetical protein
MPTPKIVLLVIAACAFLGASVAGRSYLLASAHQELRTKNFFTYEILGTRVPCSEDFDVGVSVIYQIKPSGTQYRGAKLCRGFYGAWSLRDE